MKRLSSIALVVMLACLLAVPAFAGNTDEGTLSGTHYNLNIIGSKTAKNVSMNNTGRHTIFVALGSTGQVAITKIYLTQGEFKVCDGNGFDAARNCSGQVIASGNNGAVFQLPCNTNLPASDGTITLYPCDGGATAAYEVWARALGTPKNNPSVKISTCGTETGDADGDGTANETYCSTESTVLVRNSGKSTFKNVTNELTSLCVDGPDIGSACDARYALFRDEFTDWFWEYANNGVKLAQLRFYLLN